MDKAPDAFRTISEVADDLDIPQHVLRFWETRFSQIKPMKRSGGRRYYRPDDVDLLRGIRRLLYGEGYTIRGVQRILKEHGIKSVQALADASAPASFGAIEATVGRSLQDEERDTDDHGVDADDDDYEGDEEPQTLRQARADDDEDDEEDFDDDDGPIAGVAELVQPSGNERLEAALRDLMACRRLLDQVMREGEA
ncbi:MAG TPA: MerR family transcriptional regulator [Bradyrhizobium sp.]|nr:MerR family transcriptional regulator [Bradyrhizobium sp.]